MAYFETSAKEGVSVNEAFIQMVRMGIKRESTNQINLPEGIGGGAMGGGMKLKPNTKKNQTNVNTNCSC